MHENVSRRRRALLVLGLARAREGILANLSLGLAGLTTLAALAFVPAARKAGGVALERLPSATSSVLAWGAGVTLAFAAAMQALRRDRTDGVRALVHGHGHDANAYLAARVAGLAALLGIVVGGGTAVVGVVSALASRGTAHALLALQGTLAGCVYAAAFSITVAPVAFAALGARSRAGGYLWLLTVLVLPEAVSGLTGRLVPHEWSDLVSIPRALAALRAAVAPPGFDGARGARALAVIVLVAIAATAAARAQLARADTPGDDP
jgi:hypothetical protein